MPLERATLERVLAEVNADRRPGREVRLARFTPESFELSFHDEPGPEGVCADEHFVEVQFVLSVREKVDTNIVGTKYDEGERRYRVAYEIIDWDA